MKKTRYTTEQIIMNLRKVEVMVGQGRTVQESCREIGVNEQTYYRWRNKYGGMSTSEAKERIKGSRIMNSVVFARTTESFQLSGTMR